MSIVKRAIGLIANPQGRSRLKNRIIATRVCFGSPWNVSSSKRFFAENFQLKKDIKFSILVPLYNTPKTFLADMISSVINQTYKNWELCLADGSNGEHKYVEEYCLALANNDSRIKYKRLEKNGGISENTNACIDMATGDYISLFDHDDILHANALFETARRIEETDADFVYTDEAVTIFYPFFKLLTVHKKPDFGKFTLRSNNYICHFSSFSRNLLQKVGSFDSAFDGSQDHDLILRLTEQADNVQHINMVLYYWRCHSGSVASGIGSKPYAILAAYNAVHNSVMRQEGLNCTVTSRNDLPTIYKIDYEIKGNPLVSVISSKKFATTYSNVEFVADKNDAKGEYTVTFENGVCPENDDWLEQMLMLAQQKNVKQVGGLVVNERGKIIHAGYTLDTAKSDYLGKSRLSCGYMHALEFVRNVNDVSCVVMEKKESTGDSVFTPFAIFIKHNA